MDWLEITAYTGQLEIERVADVFLDYAGGVWIEDPALIACVEKSGENEAAPGLRLPHAPAVRGYLPVDRRLEEARELLLAALAGVDPPPQVETRICRSEDWENAWREYYHAFKVGKRLVVLPAWESYASGPGEIIIRLDPGLAFGTGTHPTTRFCLELMEELPLDGAVVADVGTGSGILAVCAALLGARRVVAVDKDSTAIRSAQENILLNKLDAVVELYEGDLFTPLSGGEVFDLVLANLTADPVIRACALVGQKLKPGGFFIASGVIAARSDEVEAIISRHGLNVIGKKTDGQWVAYLAAGRG